MKWSEFANQTCTVTTSAAKMLPKQAKIKVAKTDLIPVLQSKQEPEIKVHNKIYSYLMKSSSISTLQFPRDMCTHTSTYITLNVTTYIIQTQIHSKKNLQKTTAKGNQYPEAQRTYNVIPLF